MEGTWEYLLKVLFTRKLAQRDNASPGAMNRR
jgi:hypothetical protein